MVTISVVITTYNRATLLRETLEHLVAQQYEPGDEILLVDNGSTDGTANVIARAATGFPVPLRQLRELTPGKSPALNAAIAEARGDILALTDDDVLVADDWISTIRRLFRDPALALVGGRVDPRWACTAPRWLRLEHDGRYTAMSSPLALLHYGEAQELGDRTAVGANIAVRRSVIDVVGTFAPHLGRQRGTLLCGEDHEFCQRVAAAGYRCEYRPELRVRHWVPAERMRLRYYLRWFFWAGITHGVLESTANPADPGRTETGVPRYLVRRLLIAPLSAFVQLLAGQAAQAAVHAMDGAFAAGYIAQRLRTWRSGSAVRDERRGTRGIGQLFQRTASPAAAMPVPDINEKP